MQVPESPFERYISERYMSFAYLMCPSVSGSKVLKKTCQRFAIFNISEKLQKIFEIGLKKYGAFIQNSLSLKKYLKGKFADTFLLFMC